MSPLSIVITIFMVVIIVIVWKYLLSDPFTKDVQEVCHYAIKTSGMSNENAKLSGRFPKPHYLSNVNIPNKRSNYQYQVMFNVLTTNSLFRATARAIRDAGPSIINNLHYLTVSLQKRIQLNPNSMRIHRHQL